MIRLEPVETDAQAEHMRRIRNSVRHFMTRNQNFISWRDQHLWFNSVYLPQFNEGVMEAFLARSGDVLVGYGIVAVKEGRQWITGAISASSRGRGLGRQLFEQLTLKACENSPDVWLEVLKTNKRALSLYLSLQYSVVDEYDRLLVMRKSCD